MVAQNTPYKVSIDTLTSFKGITQRVQFTMDGNIYDIDWDSVNERVIVYEGGKQEQQQKWWEICHNDVEPSSIRLIDVFLALNCVSDDTIPVLVFHECNEYTIDNYLVTPISTPFLIQMDVRARCETHSETVAIPDAEEDEDPTSSEDEDESRAAQEIYSEDPISSEEDE